MKILLLYFFANLAKADMVPLIDYAVMEIPITPFSNMASGYQATNPGFRAILKSQGGDFIAGGHMTMDAVIRGETDDASQGSAYGRLILKMNIEEAYPGIANGLMQGKYNGLLSICMAQDTESYMASTQCKSLQGNLHGERPFQWLDKPVEFEVNDGNIRITKYSGNTGEGGTSRQIALSVFHPAYGFAAPGKAFKDYQSPIVLDLNGNGKVDLVNVWADRPQIRFDFEGSGQKLRTGWVKSSDGFLFWDNGTGCVANGKQLFGESTLEAKFDEPKYENGFDAMAKLLDPKATGKVVVKNFPQLKIWQDKNQDGVCQKREVASASRWVKEIPLAYTVDANPKLQEDNEVRMKGSYIDVHGKKQFLADVWFKIRRNDLAHK